MSIGKVGAVMVVGAGIAGVQASLDLANAGYYVYLVEKSSAIGGRMAQLDKTFPTDDCSMCIVSPKLVECGRHLNIEIITNSEVKSVAGLPGNFSVDVNQEPRYVEKDACIACGVCAEKCPRKVPNDYNERLDKRKAAYVQYAQAVPLQYAIDEENCIFFQKGKCKACQKFCPSGAINFEQKKILKQINVGSIILATGFKPFDPSVFDTYSYSKNPNVVTSMEFERILSASGPFQGHLQRPSDGVEPKKIAWLQCIGSRDVNRCDHGYCSAVCCMYGIKEAVIAKEHSQESLETAIFFMDMRTHGKDFEKYYNRAREEHGVRFLRARVHTIDSMENDQLRINYASEEGEIRSEVFDMVVLSVGLEVDQDTVHLAEMLDIELSKHNFSETSSFTPVETNRPGIFACGCLVGPKDIPQTVVEASAAACAATVDLKDVRGALAKNVQYPVEKSVIEETPRIGVFVCNCGINIGGVVDVSAVREYASSLPYVEFVDENLFTCSQDTQNKIKEKIQEHGLNRIVVASCSPRTHEPLFQETLREVGLNKYLFEMANIRDQDSWVHQMEPEKATSKAKDLVRMAVAKVVFAEPLHQVSLGLNKNGLVVGGGIAGMNAALRLADSGYLVYLVEKEKILGGNAHNLLNTWKGEAFEPYLEALIAKVNAHPKIEVYLNSNIISSKGFVGNFVGDIVTNGKDRTTIEFGVVLLTTGGHEVTPNEYLYGQHDSVMTSLEFDGNLKSKSVSLKKVDSVAFIQCVGSREEERPYCSRLCCTHSIESAIKVKKNNPNAEVYVLYRDIRTYGVREDLYKEARELGVLFFRYNVEDKPIVKACGENKVSITIKDHVLGKLLKLEVNFLVLAAAIEPNEIGELTDQFKVSLNAEKFFLEAHMKLRPVDFPNEGLYLAGLAHYPKPVDEAIAQAEAAVGRALTVLAKDKIRVGGVVASVDHEKCSVCLTCVRTCPYSVPKIKDSAAYIEVASCYGCGSCVAECPGKAITLQHYTDIQILAKEKAAFS